VVAQNCKASWELSYSLVCVIGPFAARGAQGEEEYPYRWMGGIGQVSAISKQEMDRAQAWDNHFRFIAFGYDTHI
jgi:hypothetical protein